jgi:hypothetical protein
MKTITILLAFLIVAPASAHAQRLQLESLDRLADEAAEVVNLTIDAGMLKFAGAFLKGQGDEAELKALLSGLEGIYIRTYEFDRERSFSTELGAVRKQLAGQSWSRLVTVDSTRERELVEVYSWLEGGASRGLAIVVAQPAELTIVNIVGPIDLEKLGALEGLGVPRLPATPAPEP